MALDFDPTAGYALIGLAVGATPLAVIIMDRWVHRHSVYLQDWEREQHSNSEPNLLGKSPTPSVVLRGMVGGLSCAAEQPYRSDSSPPSTLQISGSGRGGGSGEHAIQMDAVPLYPESRKKCRTLPSGGASPGSSAKVGSARSRASPRAQSQSHLPTVVSTAEGERNTSNVTFISQSI
uniref:Uncharacterized protein n=1 Tax=Haptolina brevifila TaxID=156173 RepID=A0A7S2C501_9EUKA|mmetsp:Transcript_2051/g.4181  ORF Transcript_2051/g.4181 Transcript_2051/m.4181 type:complete len:178 (+) Transcript_2051:46-579(+)